HAFLIDGIRISCQGSGLFISRIDFSLGVPEAYDFVAEELSHGMAYLISDQGTAIVPPAFHIKIVDPVCNVDDFVGIAGESKRSIQVQFFSKVEITGKIHIQPVVGHFGNVHYWRRSGTRTTNQFWSVQQIIDVFLVVICTKLNSSLKQASVNTNIRIDVLFPLCIWVTDTGLLEAFYNSDAANGVIRGGSATAIGSEGVGRVYVGLVTHDTISSADF